MRCFRTEAYNDQQDSSDADVERQVAEEEERRVADEAAAAAAARTEQQEQEERDRDLLGLGPSWQDRRQQHAQKGQWQGHGLYATSPPPTARADTESSSESVNLLEK